MDVSQVQIFLETEGEKMKCKACGYSGKDWNYVDNFDQKNGVRIVRYACGKCGSIHRIEE